MRMSMSILNNISRSILSFFGLSMSVREKKRIDNEKKIACREKKSQTYPDQRDYLKKRKPKQTTSTSSSVASANTSTANYYDSGDSGSSSCSSDSSSSSSSCD